MSRYAQVISQILKLGLLTTADVCLGEVRVEEISRRHSNFKVATSKGSSYFLKCGLDAEKSTSLRNEAVVYQLLGAETNPKLLRFLTNCFGYDEEHSMLKLELLDGVQNFREFHAGGSLPSIEIHAQLGEALALLHSGTEKYHLNQEPILSGPARLPWVFTIHRPTPSTFSHASRANLDLIKAIQQFPVMCDALEVLQQQWELRSCIHFDIRWDNLLVAVPQGEDEGRLKIVDWELTAIGDPCWDTGSVFHEYLNTWLMSMPIAANVHHGDLLELAAYPLEPMQPGIRAFWQSYVEWMKVPESLSERWLIRSVNYAAARLLQTVYERMQQSTELTSTAVASVQVSMNILERPSDAASYLFGID